MLDDVNDFNPDSGKPMAADLKNGQINFVALELLALKPEFKSEIARIKETGEFHAPAELETARQTVVQKSLELERDLNRRFQVIAKNASHTHGVFEKMLVKVRETFNKKA
jgi:geranylgeranyl pyrophosphate synthase